MIKFFSKLPFLKRLIPSFGTKFLKLIGKNRGYFKIRKIYFFLDFLDPVDRQIIIHEEYEDDQVSFLENQIRKNYFSYFLDIGANSGYYSFYLADKFKSLKIKAFEPNIDAFNKFNKTLEKNSFKNIEIFNFGLSDIKRKVKMKSMIKHGYSHTNSAIIDFPQENSNEYLKIFDAKLRVGDDLFKFKNKKLSIKIDVEGHELSTLRGLINNLNQNKCLILIEIGKEKFNEVNNFLNRNNFIKIFKSKYRLDYAYTNFNSLNN